MTTTTAVNQEDVSVTQASVTNWNGDERDAYQLPEFAGRVDSTVVDEVSGLLNSFVFGSENNNTMMTLWSGHANVFDWFPITPRLGFTAGIHECGKSQAMEACQLLVNNSYFLSDVTPAAFFTYTQHGDKALFIDEMRDCLGKGESSLRSALKTGMKSNGSVPRVEMGTNGRRVVQFRTYSAVAFGGVSVKETIDIENRSRTHWVPMQRAMLGEDPETLDQRKHLPKFQEVGSRYLKWLRQNEDAIRNYDTSKMPVHVIGRRRDKWLPLFAIADVAGSKWVERVKACAFEELDNSEEMTDNLQALKAIWDIYHAWEFYSHERMDSKSATGDLCRLLAKWVDEDGRRPYAKFNKGIDPEDQIIRVKQLTALLGSFITPKGERLKTEGHRSDFDPTDRRRGYRWVDLLDMAERHLPQSALSCHGFKCDREVFDD
mgnify:FL=1